MRSAPLVFVPDGREPLQYLEIGGRCIGHGCSTNNEATLRDVCKPFMNDLAHLPRLASIVFVRVRDFDSKPVRGQVEAGEQLHALIGSVLAEMPPEGRLVLDAAGGSAIVVPDDPTLALAIAERLHARAAPLELCIGVNHGPVKLAQMEDSTALLGDGLQAAAVTAGFAAPERWLAARPFRDALAAVAPEEAERLAPAGLFTDTQVRSHELFAIDLQALQRRRRRTLLCGSAAVAAILAAGVAARLLKNRAPAPVAAAEKFDLPARVLLDIKPAGEVYVDGKLQGQLPGLTELYLPPGRHQVEVRYGGQRTPFSELNLHASEKITLTHRFAAPPPPPPPPPQRRIGRDTLPAQRNATPAEAPEQREERPGFWRGLLNKLK
ncbi:MAG: hypothetical protein JWN73_2305 [Betaproteobacteria bacterium]|nr:hypothetical protein [Betaproteobacteria bacterium]